MTLALLSLAALAAGKADARALFDAYEARESRFDPALAELYADDALISTTARAADGTTSEAVLPFAVLRDQMPMIMEIARATDERSTYARARVSRTDTGWRITADRWSVARCYTDEAFALDLAERDGLLRIVHHHTYTQETSSCATGGDLHAHMEALRGLLEPALPIQVDDVTSIDAVRTEGDTFVYVQRLQSIPIGDPATADLALALAPLTVANVCGPSMLRALLDEGGAVRLEWVHAGGEPLADFTVGASDCL